MLSLLILVAVVAVATACLLMCEMRAADKARQGYWKKPR